MQVHVLIAKAMLFQLQDEGLSRLTSALGLFPRYYTMISDMLHYWHVRLTVF